VKNFGQFAHFEKLKFDKFASHFNLNERLSHSMPHHLHGQKFHSIEMHSESSSVQHIYSN
jgi:hypothetical protein